MLMRLIVLLLLINIEEVVAMDNNKTKKKSLYVSKIISGESYAEYLHEQKSFFKKLFSRNNKGEGHVLKWSQFDKINVTLRENSANELGSSQSLDLMDIVKNQIKNLRETTSLDINLAEMERDYEKEATSLQKDFSIQIELNLDSAVNDNDSNSYKNVVHINKQQDLEGYSVGSSYKCIIYFDRLYEIKKALIFIQPSTILGVVPYQKITAQELKGYVRDSLMCSLGLRFDSHSLEEVKGIGISQENMLNYLYNRKIRPGMSQTDIFNIIRISEVE